jgi:hypothetical protein
MPPVPRVTPHPGNDYYVNILTHSIQRQSNPLLGQALEAAGFLGPFTFAKAEQVAAGNAPGEGPIVGGVTKATSDLGGINAIGDFFNRLTEGNTWLRVGEVVAGLIILYIGLNAVMRGTPVEGAVQTATKNAKRAVEVAGIPK